jgi:hypothetical protein
MLSQLTYGQVVVFRYRLRQDIEDIICTIAIVCCRQRRNFTNQLIAQCLLI